MRRHEHPHINEVWCGDSSVGPQLLSESSKKKVFIIARYGLEFNPFLKNSRDIYIETDETKEVRFRLDCLSRKKG